MNNLRLAHLVFTGYLVPLDFKAVGEFTAVIKMLLKDVNSCLLPSKNKSVNLMFDRNRLH